MDARIFTLSVFALLLTLVPATSRSGDPEPPSRTYPETSTRLEVALDGDGLPHGTGWEYDAEGRLVAEHRYKHGQRDGLSRLFYPSGRVMTEWVYTEGVRNGFTIGYYENGKVKDRGNYVNDKLEGVVRFFRSDGSLQSEMHFKNDKPHGQSTTYFSGGGIENIYTYEGGRVVHRKTYDEKGRLVGEQNYSRETVQP